MKKKSNGRLRQIFIFNLIFAVLGMLFFTHGVPFLLDQAEKETQWRAERHCAQGYHCNAKRGA